MKLLISIVLAILFLQPFPALAEIKTIIHTVQQPFGGSQSPDDARTAGIARAKREALEQFGTYIESTTVVKDSRVDSDEILALTAGVAKAEVIKQKNYTDGDTFGIEITVKVELDTAVLESGLKRLLEDRNHLKDLKAAREREKKLLERIAELEKENQQKGKTKQQSAKLKKEFQTASQGLTAVEWFDKAMVLWEGKNYSDPNKAIEYLSQAIRLDPTQAGVYYMRAFGYFGLKQFDRAIADFNQAIRLVPNFSEGYNIRGAVYGEMNQWSRAIADYNQAISLNPNFAPAYNGRAIAYFNLNQFSRAIADFDQVIHLNPNDEGAYISRGSSYGALKQFDRAIADYDQAIRLAPNDAMTYNLRGAAYFILKNTTEGCVDFSKACSLGECGGYEMARQGKHCR